MGYRSAPQSFESLTTDGNNHYLGLPTSLREQGYILTQDIWKRGSWTSKIWSGYTHGYRSCNDIHSQKRLLHKGSNHTLLIGELIIITKCSGV